MAVDSKQKNILSRTNTKPPLKWAGGKRWLLPELRKIWEKHEQRRLVEPFCGGLAVTLGLSPKLALLSDINVHAINFYHCLQKGLQINVEMRNEEDFYYQERDRFNQLIELRKENSKEAAGLFYYLNRTGYNGLCRFNKEGKFNAPFGRYKSINYLSDFSQYKGAMKNWQFISGDFARLSIEPDDFVYADPPYDVEFTQYSKEGFSWQDQERLARWLAGHPGPTVLSNQATERIISLYKKLGFQLQFLDAPRMISCTGDRTKSREVLATKGI